MFSFCRIVSSEKQVCMAYIKASIRFAVCFIDVEVQPFVSHIMLVANNKPQNILFFLGKQLKIKLFVSEAILLLDM